jgi:HK97 family phage major capsid protein
MLSDIPQLRRQRASLLSKARELVNSAEREGRSLLADEEAEFEKLTGEARDLGVKISHEERIQSAEMAAASPTHGNSRIDVGRQFVESEAYRSMRERGVWSSDPCIYRRSIIASAVADAGAGVAVLPQVVPGIVGVPQQPLRIRDLFNVAPTQSNSIAFVRETLFTNAAAAVKESIEGSEQEKPESAKAFEPEVVQVQTIAHWIPATRQIVADAPGLQAFINTQLLYGLKVEEEYELLFGSGTSPHLTGVCPLATPYDPTLPTQLGVTNITRLDHIRAAAYQVRASLYSADAVVLNPFDWAAIELVKDTQGKYIWVSVTEGGISRAWRLPVVDSDTMPQGHFLVGAFKLGAQLWDREESSIRIAEQHADFFTKNLVVILAEERLALTVYRPQAFVYGTFEEYGS